jgi:hypothetical protein
MTLSNMQKIYAKGNVEQVCTQMASLSKCQEVDVPGRSREAVGAPFGLLPDPFKVSLNLLPSRPSYLYAVNARYY